jgi:hypothetical protein
MPEPTKMQCSEFESLLSDAVEGKLTGLRLESFRSHSSSCATCGPLMAEAVEGHRWLKSLADVEPPANLVNNILIATTGLSTARLRGVSGESQVSWLDRMMEQVRGVALPVFAFARQPRFVMSFGMIFFALSLSLSLAGVKVKDVRHADLRPSAIKRTYFETSGRVVKYYENIRFVYEIESRVREFKRVTAPEETEPAKKDNRHTNDTSQEPEQRQQRNYSQGESEGLLASNPVHPPVVIFENMYRRLS